jgi:hypothetical protein
MVNHGYLSCRTAEHVPVFGRAYEATCHIHYCCPASWEGREMRLKGLSPQSELLKTINQATVTKLRHSGCHLSLYFLKLTAAHSAEPWHQLETENHGEVYHHLSSFLVRRRDKPHVQVSSI